MAPIGPWNHILTLFHQDTFPILTHHLDNDTFFIQRAEVFCENEKAALDCARLFGWGYTLQFLDFFLDFRFLSEMMTMVTTNLFFV